MPFNRRTTQMQTPAGNKPSFAAATGFSGGEIEKVQAHFSFGVDGTNAPPATSLRGDPFTVTRVSQGLYRVQLGAATLTAGKYTPKKFLTIIPELQKSAVSALGAELGSYDETNGTIDVRVINRSTGAVADPVAAGANERIHVVVTFDNGAL